MSAVRSVPALIVLIMLCSFCSCSSDKGKPTKQGETSGIEKHGSKDKVPPSEDAAGIRKGSGDKKECDCCACNTETDSSNSMVLFTMIMAVATAAMAYFNYQLVGIGSRSTDVSERSVTISEEANHISNVAQVPWIAPTGVVEIDNRLLVDTPLVFVIELKNTGITPAVNVTLRMRAAVSPLAHLLPGEDKATGTLDHREVEGLQEYIIGAIGPNVIHRQAIPTTLRLDGRTHAAIFSDAPTHRLVIWGRVEFSDHISPHDPKTKLPKDRRFMQFCMIYRKGQTWGIAGPYNNYSN